MRVYQSLAPAYVISSPCHGLGTGVASLGDTTAG